jgi:hypothetical protein
VEEAEEEANFSGAPIATPFLLFLFAFFGFLVFLILFFGLFWKRQ